MRSRHLWPIGHEGRMCDAKWNQICDHHIAGHLKPVVCVFQRVGDRPPGYNEILHDRLGYG